MKVPKNWQTSFCVKERTLVVTFAKPRLAISSAVLGGGIRKAQVVINHQVDDQGGVNSSGDHQSNIYQEPKRYLRRVMTRVTGKRSGIALMTAVDLRHLLLKRVHSGPVWVEGFFTVGIANAVCVGEPVDRCESVRQHYVPGTINIILVTNASFPHSALVSAISIATESKTAAMLEHSIKSWTGQMGATGTGTDSLVFVSGFGPKLQYSGSHTKIGELIGRVVKSGIGRGLHLIRRGPLECES